MSQIPTLAELPLPPSGKTGWPWTRGTERPYQELASNGPWPRISIVTPSYNQGRFLEETIRSILLQGYPDLEYIIIDGGSDDESVQIIKRYARWLDYWISEPDRGQSHAINKGLGYCSGEIFNWINSDDLLVPGALYAIAREWKKTPEVIIAGAGVNFDENGQEEIHKPKAVSLESFVNWRKARENNWMWQQPSTFLPRAEVSRIGGVKENLKFSMDHFLMIDLLQSCNVVYVPEILAKFRLQANSKTMSFGHLRFSLERLQTLRKMTHLHNWVTVKELKGLQVSVLLKLAGQERLNAQYSSAIQNVARAFLLSPFLAVIILLRRSALGHILRRRKNRNEMA